MKPGSKSAKYPDISTVLYNIVHTAKLADRQKRATTLGGSRAKQSGSLPCEFFWESLLVPLTYICLAVQASAF